jgi:hypothetical protein
LGQAIEQFKPYSQAILTFITVIGAAYFFGSTITSLYKDNIILHQEINHLRENMNEKFNTSDERMRTTKAEMNEKFNTSDERMRTTKAESESAGIKNCLLFAHSEEYVTFRHKKNEKELPKE